MVWLTDIENKELRERAEHVLLEFKKVEGEYSHTRKKIIKKIPGGYRKI